MKKKLSLICFFVIFFFLFCIQKVFAYDYSQSCYKESVEQLAKILFHETAGTFPNDPDNRFFVNASVAAVVVNNANVDYQTNNMASKSKWDKKIYYLRDGVYASHSSYRDNSLENIEAAKGLKNLHGQMVYISALVLSGKYTFPTNMMGQAAPYLAKTYCEPTNGWHIFPTAPDQTEICYVKGVPKTGKDVFGNNISDDSFEHYQSLAKSLMKSDYSEYTSDNVCSKVANISGGESGGSSNGNSGVNKCNVSLNIHTCENPDFVRVIYFIKLLIGILEIIVPIGLIIMGIVDFSKSVATNDETIQKKNIMLFFKRIIYAILVFAVPWVVKVIIVSLGDLTKEVNFTDCLENATSEKIDELQSDYNKLEEEYRKNNCSIDNNNDSDDEGNLDNKVNKKSNSIFIGDSRTVGMFNCVDKKSNEFSIAKGGAGYSWLNGTALTELKTTIKGKEDSYIIINMGTNSGLTENEANQYAQLYNKIATDYPNSQVVAVSVTQIDVNTAKSNGMYSGISLTSDSVNKFNGYLKNKLDSKIKYCDVYSKIASTYKTLDGVHYDCNTYKDIYNAINSCLK